MSKPDMLLDVIYQLEENCGGGIMENAPELSWDDDDYGDNDDDNDNACDVGLKVGGNNIYTHMNKYICTTHPPTQQASHPPTHPASQPACQPDSPQPTHPPTKPQCSVHYIHSLLASNDVLRRSKQWRCHRRVNRNSLHPFARSYQHVTNKIGI